MHFKLTSLVLGIAFAGICGTVLVADGQYYYEGGYYYSAPRVVYYGSPTYYSRPVYYGRPVYYSYYSPSCVYYVRPTYCESSDSDQRSSESGYSTREPTPAKPTTVTTVGAYDNRYSPQTINVQPGTTVRWVNYGQHTHTVTANDDSWDSGDIKPGATYSATFKQPGTYYYYCRHHTRDKMQGLVNVSSASGNGQSARPSSGSGY
jgi:plastocyanin